MERRGRPACRDGVATNSQQWAREWAHYEPIAGTLEGDQAFESTFNASLMPSETPVPAGTLLIAASPSFSE